MSNKRNGVTENVKLILFEEVDGLCPLCTNTLTYKKQGNYYKKFDVAHIYPLNPTESEVEELSDEERLSYDVNDLKNLIPLCKECHLKFDRPRTKSEYRKLMRIKKNLISRRLEKDSWFNYGIESDINEIIDYLAHEYDGEYDSSDLDVDLEYNPKEIDDKIDNTLGVLLKKSIKDYIDEYYLVVKNEFTELERRNPGIAEIIATQIKLYYLQLSKKKIPQSQIYSTLVEWLDKKTQHKSYESCRIVIAFYIQNCEVF